MVRVKPLKVLTTYEVEKLTKSEIRGFFWNKENTKLILPN